MRALGAPLGRSGGRNGPTPYRLDVLNPDASLEALTAGLKRNPRGRICLYGPPSTGKTAYAHYVANELDKPLLVKRASDLLAKYVRETEKNIAHMFGQAEAEDAVLLLDEADTFLRDRTTTVRSWEVSQVNEVLVRMEEYGGLFFASTNLVEALDAASLRRFDLKIRFDHMRSEHSWLLFVEVMQERGFSEHSLPAAIKQRLLRLANLTPGDFATVLRQEGILGETFDPEALLQAIEGESAAKPGARSRSIGFTAAI